MNVLSLFDGMSCGQIALNKLGIEYDKYFACEIDKYAMEVTQHNFPDTIQLGDVQKVTKESLGGCEIDLVMGGSPCQGFSFAGHGLNFDDPRSKLFFEYVRLVKELNPKYFILENVKMRKDSMDVITKYMGVEPIEINSSLVSAQTRKRLFWTNIPGVEQPTDKGIVLGDIIEEGMAGENPVKHTERNARHIRDINGKSLCATATMYKGAGNNGTTIIRMGDIEGLGTDIWRKLNPREVERLQTVPDDYTLVLNKDGKQMVSNTQRYKMLGNGWTVDVIAHIMKNAQF